MEEPITGYNKSQFESCKQRTLSSPFEENGYSNSGIKWLPHYGCAILLRSVSGQRSEYLLSIDFIGLDNHQREIHPGECTYQFSSVPKSFCILHVGEISKDSVQNFFLGFSKILNKAQEKRREQRTAADGNQGHQKTPAFIQALAIQALRCMKCHLQVIGTGDNKSRTRCKSSSLSIYHTPEALLPDSNFPQSVDALSLLVT